MNNRTSNFNKFRFYYSAIPKVISTLGQSKFAMDAVGEFIHLNQVGRYCLSGSAMSAGFLVNVGVKLPVIYAQYHHPLHESSAVANLNQHQLQNYFSKIIYKLLIALGFIATEIGDPLSAYLGGAVLLEHTMSNFNIDMTETWWTEGITQIFGLTMAGGIALANFPYDFRFLREWLHELVEESEKGNFIFNKSMVETLTLSLPVLLGGPLLSYFFMRPAISKIPGAEFILQDAGILILSLLLVTAAFVRSLGASRAVYKALAEYNNSQPQATIEKHFPTSWKATGVKLCAGLGGSVDSLSSGLCMLVGTISTALVLFHLSADEQYDFRLIIAAAVIGLCQAIQNALFGVYPGYKETMHLLYAEQVDDHEPTDLESTPEEYHLDENEDEDELRENSRIYRSESSSNLLFRNEQPLMDFSSKESDSNYRRTM